jgi:hypothetical protein
MHPALEPVDPLFLNRTIREAALGSRRWLRRLRTGAGFEVDPFSATRWVAGQTAFRAIEDLPPDDPLRAPLRAWVYRLIQLRVNREVVAAVHFERYAQDVVLDGPSRLRAPPAVALERALAEPSRRRGWLAACIPQLNRVAALARRHEERRQEVAVRLGLASPDAIESPSPRTRELARGWLEASADAFADGKPGDLTEWVDQASAPEATEGFPRTLGPFTLQGWFRDDELLRGLDLDPGAFPASTSAASSLRALARLGAAWVDGAARTDLPFVIAHDPYGLKRRHVGAIFAVLPLVPSFAQRAMGVGKSKWQTQLRHLRRAVLLESRAAAMRVLVRPAAFAGERAHFEAYQGFGEEALGFAPPRECAGALFRPHDDDSQRFMGLLLAASTHADLRERYDEDWYRNPRAIEELRALGAAVPERVVENADAEGGLHALALELTRE